MFPWSCKARLQPQRLKWIQLYKERIPIDDINCKANIVEFWFFTSRVTVVPIPAMVFKKLRFWHEKFTPCLDRTKDHFLSTPSKKKEPVLLRGILYNGGFEIQFWTNWMDHVSLHSEEKKIVRVCRVFAQIHYIRRQFYFYNHRAWS